MEEREGEIKMILPAVPATRKKKKKRKISSCRLHNVFEGTKITRIKTPPSLTSCSMLAVSLYPASQFSPFYLQEKKSQPGGSGLQTSIQNAVDQNVIPVRGIKR